MSEELNSASAALGRDKDAQEGRPRGRKRRKVSYLTIQKIYTVDYKDVNILRRFVNERGKMIPSRQSGNTAKQQRMIARAIRRARELALLPFVLSEPPPETRGGGFRRERRDRYNDGPPQNQAPVESTAQTAEAPAAEAPAAEATEA